MGLARNDIDFKPWNRSVKVKDREFTAETYQLNIIVHLVVVDGKLKTSLGLGGEESIS